MNKRPRLMKWKMESKKRKTLFLTAALLLLGAAASAQVKVKGNVYGGGEIGKVTENTQVKINGGTMEGSVYGGGQGVDTLETAGLVQGNTTVHMKDGTVERSIYGGGELGSVGTFTTQTVTYGANAGANAGKTVDVPVTCTSGGLAKVIVSGGHVGHEGSLMPVEGANPDDDDRGWIFCGSQGLADSITYYKAIAMGVVDSTYLEIDGTAVITASVYGGCENGLVLGNTRVDIKGGQIGTGYYLD